ncbi:hypothetical protein BBC0122_018370 [Bartonella choladocola]|uniref:Uncharacterized protein n=1 Tax=Bartonella choladocola TaxID=2750995 RepID=A0A1U9MJ50_9HYPH|nr:hypothetical protein BBC0122_018370 [Bartonella choladocola]
MHESTEPLFRYLDSLDEKSRDEECKNILAYICLEFGLTDCRVDLEKQFLKENCDGKPLTIEERAAKHVILLERLSSTLH